MKLPFTVEQFLEIFKNYNQAVYPMQIIFYLLAALVVFLSVKSITNASKIINSILAFLWFWMGIVYHLLYFSQVNKAAYLFGIIFIIQGLLFLYEGVFNNKLSYSFSRGLFGVSGAVLVVFALVLYPVIGYTFGHIYPSSPTFGLPCPTTIFTFGIFLWSDKRLPVTILVIPFLWSLIGFFAALKLGIFEDTGLLIAGLFTFTMIILANRKVKYSTI